MKLFFSEPYSEHVEGAEKFPNKVVFNQRHVSDKETFIGIITMKVHSIFPFEFLLLHTRLY